MQANVLNYQEQNRLNGERESAELQTNAIFNTTYESSVMITPMFSTGG